MALSHHQTGPFPSAPIPLFFIWQKHFVSVMAQTDKPNRNMPKDMS